MSGPVDVLAVLDAEIACKRIAVANGYSSEEVLNETEETRDAVAELIEALAGLVSIEDSVTQGQERDRREEWIPKARAALARVGGAS